VVGFEVLTEVVKKGSVFWDMTPYSPLKGNDVLKENAVSIFRVEK
jgi:hypothetical protein